MILKSGFALCCALVWTSVHADDLDKLRSTISLPRVSAKVQFQIVTDPQETTPETILKRLNGTEDDIDVYLEAGAAYDARSVNGKRNDQAREAYSKAEGLLKSVLQAHPKDAYTLSRLGIARWYGGQNADAEESLRNAVNLAPSDWRCAANLADFLQSSALRKVMEIDATGAITATDFSGLEAQIKQLKAQNKLAERIDNLKSASTEAVQFMDKAVSLSPSNPAVYARRFAFRLLYHTATENVLHAAANEPQDYSSVLNQQAVEDKWKQAELNETNVKAIGSALKYALMIHSPAFATEKIASESDAIASLPESDRTHIKLALEKLRNFTAHGDKRQAGIANAELAEACILLNNYPAAAEASVAAFHYDPHNAASAQAVNASYLALGKPGELIPILREEIAAGDTPARRLYLIKCLAITGKATEMKSELNAALQKFPDDFLLQLANFDELMRANSMDLAAKVLERVKGLYDGLTESEKADNRANYDIARGIYLALLGKTEIARTALQHVLDYDPDNSDAAASIRALP
jgi:hypothetical protein